MSRGGVAAEMIEGVGSPGEKLQLFLYLCIYSIHLSTICVYYVLGAGVIVSEL